MASQPSDAELVRRARGDPAAFADLYGRYVASVYRYARVRVASVQEAEDITSDVFADALAALPRYREHGQFAPWLFTIARRHVQDHYRSLRRRGDAPDDRLEPASHAAGTADPDPGAAEEVDAMRAALSRLSSDRREALELRFFGGLAYGEVAEVMRRNEGAVKMLVHRGLAQLRAVLTEPESGQDAGRETGRETGQETGA